MLVTSYTLRNYRAIGSKGAHLDLTCDFTALLGTNNSGKSSVLRSFHELRPIFNFMAQMVPSEAEQLLSRRGSYSVAPDVPPGQRIRSADEPKADPRIEIQLADTVRDEKMETIRSVSIVLTQQNSVRVEIETVESGRLAPVVQVSNLSRGASRGAYYGLSTETGDSHNIDWQHIAPAMGELAKAMYIGPFRNAINSGGESAYFDLATGTSFVAAFAGMKNGPDFESNEAITRMSSRLADIFGFRRLEVSTTPDHKQLVFNVDERSFRAGELGAGISQFVIVAANVLTRRPSMLLVDEPEANLHASLQGAFLTLLAEPVSGPVIFASHSVGLARSVADEVLVVSRPVGSSAQSQSWAAVENLATVLGELGYGGLNDSKHRALLLVEGVTEVRVFGELLAKLGIRNDVVIVPLGGDSLAAGSRVHELAELSRLSDHIFAFVDSEASTESSGPSLGRGEFLRDCAALGIVARLSLRRATENYLDQDVARQVLKRPDGECFGHFEKPSDSWGWPKAKNWRIAKAMSLEDFAGTDLLEFLTEVRASVRGVTT